MSNNKIKIQHKSLRGKHIDMDAMRMKHEDMVAIGNASMNARGDVLDSNGEVIVKREQIVQSYHRNNPAGVKQVSLKDTMGTTFETPQQAMERLAKEGVVVPKQTNPTSDITGKKVTRKMVDKTD